MDVTTSTVEDEVVDSGSSELGSEELVVDSNDSELVVAWTVLFTRATFFSVLGFVGEAFRKQEQALERRETGRTEMELGKVCLVFAISRHRRLATRG